MGRAHEHCAHFISVMVATLPVVLNMLNHFSLEIPEVALAKQVKRDEDYGKDNSNHAHDRAWVVAALVDNLTPTLFRRVILVLLVLILCFLLMLTTVYIILIFIIAKLVLFSLCELILAKNTCHSVRVLW